MVVLNGEDKAIMVIKKREGGNGKKIDEILKLNGGV